MNRIFSLASALVLTTSILGQSFFMPAYAEAENSVFFVGTEESSSSSVSSEPHPAESIDSTAEYEETVSETTMPTETENPHPECVELEPCEPSELPDYEWEIYSVTPQSGHVRSYGFGSQPSQSWGLEAPDGDEPMVTKPAKPMPTKPSKPKPEPVTENSDASGEDGSDEGVELVLALRGNERDPFRGKSVLELVSELSIDVLDIGKEVVGSIDFEVESAAESAPVSVVPVEVKKSPLPVDILIEQSVEAPIAQPAGTQLAQPAPTKADAPKQENLYPYKNVSEPTAPTPQAAMATLALIGLSLIAGVIFTIGTSFTGRKN